MSRQSLRHITPARFFVICLVAAPVAVQAASILDAFLSSKETPEEEYVQQELSVKVPAYPKDDDLHEVALSVTNSRFRYLIDLGTLSVGEDDIVRYTVAVRSNSGANNVTYEGINCEANGYKIYAYGMTLKRFRLVRRPVWKRIFNHGVSAFRYDLLRHYFCDVKYLQPHNRGEIVSRLKYPPDSSDDTYD